MEGWDPVKDIYEARTRDLRWHGDSRGALTELFRESWEGGRREEGDPEKFRRLSPVRGPEHAQRHLGVVQQVYLSETLPGVVKAFHLHRVQWDRFVCVRGRVLVVLADARPESPTFRNVWDTVLDPDRAHRALVIPPGVLHGWMTLGADVSAVLNCVSREYSPPGTAACDEFRQPPHAALFEGGDPYPWLARRDA